MKNKSKIKLIIMALLIMLLYKGKIARQFVKMRSTSENIEIYTKAIGPAYYNPYRDQAYIDVYSKSVFTDSYIHRVKMNKIEKVEFGDTIIVKAKLYKLRNKFALEPISGLLSEEDMP